MEKIEYVEVKKKKKENIYVLLVIATIVIISYILLTFNNLKKEPQIDLENKINSFSSFNSKENAIYSDLYNFSTELENFALIEGYKEILDLENDNIYPFVKDDLWENRGKIIWEKFELDNKIYYLGQSQDSEVGNFLLISYIDKDLVINNIYYTKEKITGNFLEDIKKFKEVLSLKGKELESRNYE